MGRGSTIPYRTQKAVAEKFWDYMKKENARPKTRTEMRELYSVHFRPYLTDPTEKRVLLGQVLYNLKGLKFIEKQPEGDKETIVYRGFPTVAVGGHNAVLNSATTENSGEAAGTCESERQEPEDDELAAMVAKLKKDLVSKRKQLIRDKGDISIHPAADSSDIVDMGVLNLCESKLLKLTVRNESDSRVVLQCSVLGSASNFTINDRRFNIVGSRSKVELRRHGSYVVEVKVTSQNPGIHRVPVGFEFKREDGIPFHIVKFIKAETTDDVVIDLQPTSPYVRPKPVVKVSDPEIEIIDGEPPPIQDIKYTVPLEKYPIPSVVRHQVNRGIPVTLFPSILGEVDAKYHCKRLCTILHIEELQMEVDIQRFRMEKAKLESEREYLTLRVPGLAENRPSLVRGDWLFVRKLSPDGSTAEKKEYKGFVHKVGLNHVYLKFSRGFHLNFIRNSSYQVRFDFRRTSLKLMHRALDMASSFLNQMPSSRCLIQTSSTAFSARRWYDSKIANNEEQKQAVKNIVLGTSHPYPYLVFGPPGTGKTVTLVESIKQVFDTFPDCKILACAPSNSAADLLLERVSKNTVVPKHKMVRLNAYGRSLSAVSESIKDFCKTSWDPKNGDYFYFPPIQEIMEYQLVVTTLISAGRLVSMGIGDSHFTHVFIDEAGHGMEPECLVAVAGLLGTNRDMRRQLVLAGDPKQLGPVLRSPLAIKHGLDVSFLERLMSPKFLCYNRQPSIGCGGEEGYDATMVTKLLNNYRSHPAIIELPNKLFYDNELRACANEVLRESLCRWDGLPTKGFPVIFEAVFGKDMREEQSPSFFNPQEVSVVLRYVKNLKEARGVSLETKDIGIISPYHKQVQKIRESLKNRRVDIRDIKVGSVEEFQGQERKVIIISTVRSSDEFLELDALHKLGFLRNPKRFNVAITRAKALLVVIGNPKVLLRDKHWRSFIQLCKDHNSCHGEFEMPECEDENVLAQFTRLNLHKESQEDEGDLSRAAYEGLPWKPDDE